MPRSLLRPVPLPLLRTYGPIVGRVMAGLQRLPQLERGVILGVRAGQFRLRVGLGATWSIQAHVSGFEIDRGGSFSHSEEVRATRACPGAERERERLRQYPLGLPCRISEEDGLVFVMAPGAWSVLHDSARELDDGVVEMRTKEGVTLRAYRIVERPRHLGIEDLGPAPAGQVLRPCELPALPDPLVSHYLQTELRVTDEHRRTWAVRPAEESASERLAWPFPSQAHVLTAWNPLGVPLSLTENRARQGRLLKQLARRGHRYWGGIGTQPETSPGAWIEESLLVADLSRPEAVTLGRAYHQHALFELCGTNLRLIGCRDGRLLGERTVAAHLLA